MFSRHRTASTLVIGLLLCGLAPAAQGQDLEKSLQDLAKQLYEKLSTLKVKKVTVVEFPDINGYQSVLGQYVAEKLLTELGRSAQPGVFDIVERRRLEKVLLEQQLTSTSLFDPASIAEVGKILGIEALIIGTLTDLDTEVEVMTRAISVESASTLAVGTSRFPKTEAILKLMKQAAGPSGGSSLSTATQPARSGVQRSDVYFQNSFLRIEVQSASRSEDGERVTLALSLESLTVEDLLIVAIFQGSFYTSAFLVVDDQGNSSAGCDYNALSRLHRSSGGDLTMTSNYTVLTGKSRSVVTLSCGFEKPVKGKTVAFSGSFARYKGESSEFFSAGIANIQLGN